MKRSAIKSFAAAAAISVVGLAFGDATGPSPYIGEGADFDFPFNGDSTSIGKNKETLNGGDHGRSYTADGDAILNGSVVWWGHGVPEHFTTAVQCTIPRTPHRGVLHIGNDNYGLFIASGLNAGEVEFGLVLSGNVTVLTTVTPADASTTEHFYAINSDGWNVKCYVDGELVVTHKASEWINSRGSVTIGRVGGQSGTYSEASKEGDGSCMDEFLLWECQTLDETAMAELAAVFPPKARPLYDYATWDFPFEGDAYSCGVKKTNLGDRDREHEYTEDDGIGRGIKLYCNCRSGDVDLTANFTAAAWFKAPSGDRKCLYALGGCNDAIFLSTGDARNQLRLACVRDKTVEVLIDAFVPALSSTRHMATFTVSPDAKMVRLYVDGKLAGEKQVDTAISIPIGGGLQVGGWCGGTPSNYNKGDGDAFMDELWIFDGMILSDAKIAEMAEEHPYVPQAAYVYHFNGDVNSTGTVSKSLDTHDGSSIEYTPEGDNQGVYLKCNCYNGDIDLSSAFTVMAFGLASPDDRRCILALGDCEYSLFLTTGDRLNDLVLARVVGKSVERLVTTRVPNLSTLLHSYAVTVSADGKDIRLYVDGASAGAVTLDAPINISTGGGLQVGGWRGGWPNSDSYGFYDKGNGDSYLDELVVYDGDVLDAAAIAKLAKTFTYDPLSVVPTYDFPFDGHGNSTNCLKTSEFANGDHTFEYVNNVGLKLWCNAGTPSNYKLSKSFSAAVRCTLPTNRRGTIINFGTTYDGFFLASGDEEDEIEFVCMKSSTPTVIASAKVPNATGAAHLYVITASLNDNTYSLSVDGAAWPATAPSEAPLGMPDYVMQIGGCYGGSPSGYNKANDDGSYIDELIIYDGMTIPDEIVQALAKRFPYEAEAKYDYPFDGNAVSIGTDKSAFDSSDKPLAYTGLVYGEQGLYLSCNAYGARKLEYPFSAAAYCVVPTSAHRCLVSFGNSTAGVFLATGEAEGTVELVGLTNGVATVLATASVPEKKFPLHLYSFTASADGRRFELFVDGESVAVAELATPIAKGNGIQVGGWYGGTPSGYQKGDGDAFMAELIAYEYTTLSEEAMTAIYEALEARAARRRRGFVFQIQ